MYQLQSQKVDTATAFYLQVTGATASVVHLFRSHTHIVTTSTHTQHAYSNALASSPLEAKDHFQVPCTKLGMWVNLGSKNLR